VLQFDIQRLTAHRLAGEARRAARYLAVGLGGLAVDSAVFLALSHEGAKIAAAVNRYFGYVLVGQVRLSIAAFTPGSAAVEEARPQLDPIERATVGRAVGKVRDDGLRDALRQLGHGIIAARKK